MPSYKLQAGGLPIVRCLQLRHIFWSIRVLWLHTNLKLEGYPFSVVSSYLQHTFSSVVRGLSLNPTSKLRATHCRLSPVTPYTLKYHPYVCRTFHDQQPQHAVRCGDRHDAFRSNFWNTGWNPAEELDTLRLKLSVARLHVHWSTSVVSYFLRVTLLSQITVTVHDIKLKESFLFVFGETAPPQCAMASSFTRFLDHTQRRTTVGRTPLDEWWERPVPENSTQHSQQTNIHAPGGIRTKNLIRRVALDRAATGTGERELAE